VLREREPVVGRQRRRMIDLRGYREEKDSHGFAGERIPVDGNEYLLTTIL